MCTVFTNLLNKKDIKRIDKFENKLSISLSQKNHQQEIQP